jgi:uncharacterized protein involved in propanediol utilization
MQRLTVTDDDKKILVSVLEMVNPQSVTTIKDLRQIDKICTAIEATGDVIELEDADFDFLKSRVQAFTGWVPKARRQILDLVGKLGL